MDLKQRIVWQLQSIRGLSDQMVADFKTSEDWTHQAFPRANHTLWVVGHIALGANSVLGKIFDRMIEKPIYKEKFGSQSKPSPNAADYPQPEEVLDFFRERRRTLLASIEGLLESEFDNPVPPGLPPVVQNVGQMFAFVATHEALHTGQMSMNRRSLGNPPVIG